MLENMVLLPVYYFVGESLWLREDRKRYVVMRRSCLQPEVRELKKRIRELERVLGKKTLENEILTEAVKLAHEKKLISRMPLLPQDDSR